MTATPDTPGQRLRGLILLWREADRLTRAMDALLLAFARSLLLDERQDCDSSASLAFRAGVAANLRSEKLRAELAARIQAQAGAA